MKKSTEVMTDYRKLELYKARYNRAQSVAYQWWSLLQACYHFCIPMRNLYYQTNQTQASQRNVKVYDTTQVAATRSFVSKMQNSMCPPGMQWAEFEAGTFVADDQREQINMELQEFGRILFTYLRGSNFDVAINESFFDLATGTGILCINEGLSDDKPLIFGSIPLAQCAIEESISTRAESVYRMWGETKISDIKLMWPLATITQEMEQALKQDPNATVKSLVEAVIHNPDKELPYSYVLWHENSFLLQDEDLTPPMIVFRSSKINNECFGRGVIMDALPSIISLQTIAYYELTSANLNVCRPFMGYSDGVFNPYTFQLLPNTIIPVSPSSNGQFPIQPFPDVANPAFMQLVSTDLRLQINKLMFADPLGPQEATPRTAYELQQRQLDLATEIGPMFTRLQQEFMEPVLNRVIHILQRRGLLPNIIVDGKEIKVRYKSPIALSQGQQNVNTFLEFMQTLQATVGTESSLLYIKPERVGSWMAQQKGVDLTLVNTEAEMRQFFKEKGEEEQMMAAMMAQQQQGEAQNAGLAA